MSRQHETVSKPIAQTGKYVTHDHATPCYPSGKPPSGPFRRRNPKGPTATTDTYTLKTLGVVLTVGYHYNIRYQKPLGHVTGNGSGDNWLEVRAMELNEYQRLANQTDQQPETGTFETDPRSILVPLLGMAGEAGELLGEHKKWLRDGDSYKLFPERVKEELGDLLWYLSNVATKHGLTLEEVADFNLSKTRRRWQPASAGKGARKLFDEDFPVKERLPRQMDISIEEESGIAITTIDGAKFGDPLRDNRYEDDGYRFHDICHLSYARFC